MLLKIFLMNYVPLETHLWHFPITWNISIRPKNAWLTLAYVQPTHTLFSQNKASSQILDWILDSILLLVRQLSLFVTGYYWYSLRKKCPYSELFWTAFFPRFKAIGLNTDRYSVSVRIQSKCGEMQEKCGPE